MTAQIGKGLILLGLLLVAAGAWILPADRIPFPGRLPGDIVIRRENVTLYLPLASCLLISLILSILFLPFRR